MPAAPLRPCRCLTMLGDCKVVQNGEPDEGRLCRFGIAQARKLYERRTA